MVGSKICSVIILLGIIKSVFLTSAVNDERYDPTWDSLDKRPLPSWYDEAKIGIFLHWGVYSVPGFGSEWFWANWKSGSKDYKSFMETNYAPGVTYQDFARDFTAELYNPDEWADIFKKSGAKYVVLTSKHHEGYTLWPSKYSFSWNAMDVGPNKDLVGTLAQAVRKQSLKFGVYHSLYEWYNPLWLADKQSNFTTNNFVVNKVIPEMMELVQNYQPEVLWSDGDWEASDKYWKSTEFLAWLYNESPVKDSIVVNDRWGINTPCKHGDFYTCQDRYDPRKLQNHKWESAMTIDRVSWGYRRNAVLSDFYTTQSLIEYLVRTISCGGNLLMNVGPTHDGRIDYIFQDRLLNLGEWLMPNGEAIYGTKPWKLQNDTINENVWYTAKNSDVYAIALQWPKNNIVQVGGLTEFFKNASPVITLLETNAQLKWKSSDRTIDVTLPDKATVAGKWAWVLKIHFNKSTENNEIY